MGRTRYRDEVEDFSRFRGDRSRVSFVTIPGVKVEVVRFFVLKHLLEGKKVVVVGMRRPLKARHLSRSLREYRNGNGCIVNCFHERDDDDDDDGAVRRTRSVTIWICISLYLISLGYGLVLTAWTSCSWRTLFSFV